MKDLKKGDFKFEVVFSEKSGRTSPLGTACKGGASGGSLLRSVFLSVEWAGQEGCSFAQS